MAEIDSSASRKVKDTIAGFAGGVAQVLIGQPADLVKVRLQTSVRPTNSVEVIKNVFKYEGPLAFYKGTSAPLIGVGACVSLQFYGFYEAQRQLLRSSGQSRLNLWPQVYIAGACAGILNTPIASPIEQLRILSQSNTKHEFRSIRSTVRNLYSSNGIIRGIYRGFNITLLREIQSYGVWFLTYEYLISSLLKSKNLQSRDQIAPPQLLACGAAAGNALWLSAYPLDVIKSNVQSDKFGPASLFRGSAILALKHVFAQGGLRGFWKGIIPCLLRATPCSAGTFATVELALRVLG